MGIVGSYAANRWFANEAKQTSWAFWIPSLEISMGWDCQKYFDKGELPNILLFSKPMPHIAH